MKSKAFVGRCRPICIDMLTSMELKVTVGSSVVEDEGNGQVHVSMIACTLEIEYGGVDTVFQISFGIHFKNH